MKFLCLNDMRKNLLASVNVFGPLDLYIPAIAIAESCNDRDENQEDNDNDANNDDGRDTCQSNTPVYR